MGISTTEYSGETRRWRRLRRSSTTIGEGGEDDDDDDDDDDLADERGASIRGGIILGDVWKESHDRGNVDAMSTVRRAANERLDGDDGIMLGFECRHF
jgi:hypothetical protein